MTMPSTLNYTLDQLRIEAGLLVVEFATFVDMFTGRRDAGMNALGIDTSAEASKADRELAESRFPDDFAHRIERFRVWSDLEALHQYVQQQQPLKSPLAVEWLDRLVAGVFTNPVLKSYGRDNIGALDGDEILSPLPDDQLGQDVGAYYMRIIPQLIAHAKARLKVDQDEALTLGDIALLTGQKEQTVMTAAHRKRFLTRLHEGRRLARVADAIDYLKAYGFAPTQQHQPEGKVAAPAEGSIDDVIFVPVSRSGVMFLPDSRVNGRYLVGGDAADEPFNDYFHALARLQRMTVPRWRGKTRGPELETITGTRFERVGAAQINAAIQKLT
jgi:hypothetical protein